MWYALKCELYLAMTESGLIDALPYTDEGYEDDKVREAAARLIEEEVKR